MTLVMRCEGTTGIVMEGDGDATGQFLSFYDPDGFDGHGHAEWVTNPAEALHFPDAVEALTLWKQVSKTRPLRQDGLPNRPLTAFTVSILPIEDTNPD